MVHTNCEHCGKPLAKPSLKQKYHKECKLIVAKELNHEHCRRYRDKHAEKLNAYNRRYRQENLERLALYQQEYYKEHRGRNTTLAKLQRFRYHKKQGHIPQDVAFDETRNYTTNEFFALMVVDRKTQQDH